MLRPSAASLAAILALCLCSGSPALAQDAGYGAELNQLEEQLEADIKACKPVDPKPYDQLAARLKELVERLTDNKTQGGAPIDAEKIMSDSNRAAKLASRAKAAAKPRCPLEGGTSEILVDTKVEPPKLSPVTPAGNNYKPSVQTIEDSGPDFVGMFRAALARYLEAKKRCDGPGMMAARAEMDAAQGAAREILAKEKVLGGKSELLKQMAEQRQAAENGTIGMCPSLTPALAHLLSEPPRASSEPMTDEPSKPYTPVFVNSGTHAPAYADPALAARAHALCSGPGLEDHAALPGVSRVVEGEGAAAPRVGLDYTFRETLGTGGYERSVENPAADAPRSDEPRIPFGLKYEFAGRPVCPTYQETRVPQPGLPNQETFDPRSTGSIDPDDSPPLKVYPMPKEDTPPPP